jgi:hypothetical protein
MLLKVRRLFAGEGVNRLDDESRFIVFKSDRRKEDDQMAIVGNTVYQCRDGFRMFTENEDGSYISYGIYFGPQSPTPAANKSGASVGKRNGSDRPIRFACLKEQ